MTKLEEVARALRSSLKSLGYAEYEIADVDFVTAARAGVEALREPGEEMILAGAKAGVDQVYHKCNAWDRCVPDEECRSDYCNFAKFSHQAMIDAILNEET